MLIDGKLGQGMSRCVGKAKAVHGRIDDAIESICGYAIERKEVDGMHRFARGNLELILRWC